MSRLQTCCTTFGPGDVADFVTCLNGAGLSYNACLARVVVAPPPETCFSIFLNQITGCRSESQALTCDAGELQAVDEACNDNALKFLEWCEVVVEVSFTGPDFDGEVRFGSRRRLHAVTHDPRVDGLSYWLIQSDATLEDRSEKVLKLGDGAPTGQGAGGGTVWEMTADTVAWPIADDERVILLAVAKRGDVVVGTTHVKLDVIVDPIDVDGDGTWDCPADMDLDGRVTALDLVAFRRRFDARDPVADIARDGVFDERDLIAFQQFFREGCK